MWTNSGVGGAEVSLFLSPAPSYLIALGQLRSQVVRFTDRRLMVRMDVRQRSSMSSEWRWLKCGARVHANSSKLEVTLGSENSRGYKKLYSLVS